VVLGQPYSPRFRHWLNGRPSPGEQRGQSLYVCSLLFTTIHRYQTNADIVGRRKEVLDNAVEKHGKTLAHPSGQLIPIQGDIGSKESIQKFVNEISQHEKYINLLVNNAGISKGSTEVEKGDESAEDLSKDLFNEGWDDWMETYQTNVVGCALACALPMLR
jgi:NAD(P)-dependent dehydrogenase (short-subunit alcohol dehydrogenase family)